MYLVPLISAQHLVMLSQRLFIFYFLFQRNKNLKKKNLRFFYPTLGKNEKAAFDNQTQCQCDGINEQLLDTIVNH